MMRSVWVAVVFSILPTAGYTADEPAALVRRAIDVAGGKEKLASTRRSYLQAVGYLFKDNVATPFRVELWRDAPGRSRLEMTVTTTTGAVRVTTASADGKWWCQHASGPAVTLEGAALDLELVGEHASWVADLIPILTDPVFTLTPLGEAQIGTRKADGVKVGYTGKPDVSLWFDREDGVLVKRAVRQPIGVQEEVLSEYKEFGGVKRPTRKVIYCDGVKVCEDQVTEYKVLDKLDDALFQMPAPAPAVDAKEVIRKHVAAAGGAEQFKKLPCEYVKESTRIFAVAGPIDFDCEDWSDYPTAVRQVLTLDPGRGKVVRTQVYANGGGWKKDEFGQPPHALLSGEVQTWKELTASAWRAEVFHLLDDPMASLASLGRGEVGGQAAVGVKVTWPDLPEMRLWFDAETHLLIKQEDVTPGGKPREKYLSDYTEKDGIKRPTKKVVCTGGLKVAEITVREHPHFEKLDPALLERPKE